MGKTLGGERYSVQKPLIGYTEVRSETILHELPHLKYPNHGRLFNILLNIYLKRKAEDCVKDRDTVAE